MNLSASFIIMILRFVLNENLMNWLSEQAKKTETPIDDTAVAIIRFLLQQKVSSDENKPDTD